MQQSPSEADSSSASHQILPSLNWHKHLKIVTPFPTSHIRKLTFVPTFVYTVQKLHNNLRD
jgi:hypothetical protein